MKLSTHSRAVTEWRKLLLMARKRLWLVLVPAQAVAEMELVVAVLADSVDDDDCLRCRYWFFQDARLKYCHCASTDNAAVEIFLKN